jgi:hypothetical protein
MRWFYGDKPDLEEATKKLSKDEQFQEGILRLRRGAQYEPTSEDLVAGKFTTARLLCLDREEFMRGSLCFEEMLYMHLSDIYQRYAQSCYDRSIRRAVGRVIASGGHTEELRNALINASSLNHTDDSLDLRDETQVRECMYRSIKLLSCQKDSAESDQQPADLSKRPCVVSSAQFDQLLGTTSEDDKYNKDFRCNECEGEGIVEFDTIKLNIIRDSASMLVIHRARYFPTSK